MKNGFAWVPAGLFEAEGAVVGKVEDSLAGATVFEAAGRQFLLTHAMAAPGEDLIRGLEGIVARLRAISALGSLARVSLQRGFRVEDIVAVRVVLRDEADRAAAERWSARRLPRESALWLRHRCLVVRGGVFSKCTRAAYHRDFRERLDVKGRELGALPEPGDDGIALDAMDFEDRLLAYLNADQALDACRYRHGSSGPLVPHVQLSRRDVREERFLPALRQGPGRA